MALSGAVKVAHDSGTLTLLDGTATPITLTLRWDKGDFNWDGVKHGMRETVAIVGRGKVRSLRKGAPVQPTLSFSAHVTDFSESGTGTLFDWVAKTAGTPFASRVSTTAAIGDIDTSHVKFVMEGTAYGDSADHPLMFKDVELSIGFTEAEDGNSFTLSGTVWGDITDGSTTTYHAAARG